MRDDSILIVAGEASGDEHAAGLIDEVKHLYPHSRLEWYGSGGERMARRGVDLMADVERLAAIGPAAALGNLASYWKLYRGLLQRARRRRPRLAVLVDFPEFNLLLARRLKKMAIPVCYFISPQIWAWRSSRVRKVRRYVDRMLVILPFEEEFYRRHGVEARYVGNPTAGRLGLQPASRPAEGQPPLVALLPGSRGKEVEHIFPLQLETARQVVLQSAQRGLPRPRFRVAAAPTVELEELRSRAREWVQRSGGEPLELEFIQEDIRTALAGVDFALVKSGTSTLEAMILQVPFAMLYSMSLASWLFGRLLVDTDTYCLANIVAGRRVVREFVQQQARPPLMASHIVEHLADPARGEALRQALAQGARRLGEHDAYRQAARQIGIWIDKEKEAA
ncbi:MAG TPA: lipid-A-disaccharide synthase [Acidobacteriota bacterium]|nr:lipid-A-disaccharide synthase [Acidobacteriota bacterium]